MQLVPVAPTLPQQDLLQGHIQDTMYLTLGNDPGEGTRGMTHSSMHDQMQVSR